MLGRLLAFAFFVFGICGGHYMFGGLCCSRNGLENTFDFVERASGLYIVCASRRTSRQLCFFGMLHLIHSKDLTTTATENCCRFIEPHGND